MEELAWIDDGERRFIARCPLPRPWADSAIVRLIQGVWEREPEQARRILRQRISATSPEPSEMCLGMVKVAAKRLERGASLEASPSPESWIECDALPPAGWVEQEGRLHDDVACMRLALELVRRIEPGTERYLSDRRVAAVLVSREGDILGAALNTNARNRTRHAEVNLVQGYCRRTGQPIPEGARLYVTLKSCKMCAAMVWSASADPASIQVIYSEEDEGPMARLTVFTEGSHERQRAAGNDVRLRTAKIEKRRPHLFVADLRQINPSRTE